VYLRAINFQCNNLPLALNRVSTCTINISGDQLAVEVDSYANCNAHYAYQNLNCIVDTTDGKFRPIIRDIDLTSEQIASLESLDSLAHFSEGDWFAGSLLVSGGVVFILLLQIYHWLTIEQVNATTKYAVLGLLALLAVPVNLLGAVSWMLLIGYID